MMDRIEMISINSTSPPGQHAYHELVKDDDGGKSDGDDDGDDDNQDDDDVYMVLCLN